MGEVVDITHGKTMADACDCEHLTRIITPRLNCIKCGPTNHVMEHDGVMFCVPCVPAMVFAVEVERRSEGLG